tara:strand:- start:277 stop:489 length:213 start_codon:yes stop_codon:yes gene_type:complete
MDGYNNGVMTDKERYMLAMQQQRLQNLQNNGAMSDKEKHMQAMMMQQQPQNNGSVSDKELMALLLQQGRQ